MDKRKRHPTWYLHITFFQVKVKLKKRVEKTVLLHVRDVIDYVEFYSVSVLLFAEVIFCRSVLFSSSPPCKLVLHAGSFTEHSPY